MSRQLIAQVKNNTAIKYIFCDYYDTIVHRTVHPLKPYLIWANAIKKDLSLPQAAKDIYTIRRDALKALSKGANISESEIPYGVVMQEVYDRLNIDDKIAFEDFKNLSYEADYHAEASVQYANKKTIASLEKLNKEGYLIYCVSDFHSDEKMLHRLMQFHGIDHIYSKIFVSASQNASKENKGELFKSILAQEDILPNEVIMVGDNPKSDVANSKLHGIESHFLTRRWYKLRQKVQFVLLSLMN